jgi:hypothetical protein
MANSVASYGVFLSGSQTVPSNGTAVALGTGIYGSLTIKAKVGNTGNVFLGGPDVSSSTNEGLAAGAVINIDPSRGHAVALADIYIDVGTNDDGVDFYATY